MTPIKDLRIEFPKEWKEAIKRCKVIEFLNGESGEDIVADFFQDLKSQNGSRFNIALKMAAKRLTQRIHGYYLIREVNQKSYQAYDRDVLKCLKDKFDEKTMAEITAVSIISILHEQDAEM